jgi:hypothetical protein
VIEDSFASVAVFYKSGDILARCSAKMNIGIKGKDGTYVFLRNFYDMQDLCTRRTLVAGWTKRDSMIACATRDCTHTNTLCWRDIGVGKV